MRKGFYLSVLSVVIATGAICRIYAIGMPSPLVDDAFALYFAKFPLTEIWGKLYAGETHPPLFYFVLHLWQRLVGFDISVAQLNDFRNVWWLNLVIYFAVAGALVRLARTLEMHFWTTILLVTLYALSEFHIRQTTELRSYPLFVFFFLLSLHFCLRFKNHFAQVDLIGWTLVVTAGIYTHYYFAIPAAVQIGFLGLTTPRGSRRRFYRAIFLLTLCSLPAGGVLANRDKLHHRHSFDHTIALRAKEIPTVLGEATLSALSEETGSRVIPLFALGLFICLATQRRKWSPGEILLGTTAFGPLAGLWLAQLVDRKGYLPRYFIFVHFSWMILVAVLVSHPWAGRVPRSAAVLLLALGLCDAGFAVRNKLIVAQSYNFPPTQEGTLASRGWRKMLQSGFDAEFRETLCRGRVDVSDDYAAAELLLNFCPEIFARLKNLSTQFVRPSFEWRSEKPALGLIYLDDAPSRRREKSAASFFARRALYSPDDYFFVRLQNYSIWVAKPRHIAYQP